MIVRQKDLGAHARKTAQIQLRERYAPKDVQGLIVLSVMKMAVA